MIRLHARTEGGDVPLVRVRFRGGEEHLLLPQDLSDDSAERLRAAMARLGTTVERVEIVRATRVQVIR